MGEVVFGQAPNIKSELDRSQIYFGETVTYSITVRNAEKHEPPEVEAPPAIELQAIGNRVLDTKIAVTRNGRRREFVRKGRQYNYRLTPTQPGRYTIPAPTVKVQVDGASKSIQGSTTTLIVRAPDVQSNVLVEVDADRSVVYPAQPFTLTLRILIRDLPGDLSGRNPLAIYEKDPLGFPGVSRQRRPGPPLLEIPWLDDDLIPTGVNPQESLSDLLRELATDTGQGFRVNGLRVQTAFALLNESGTAFQFPSTRVTRSVAGEDVNYWQFEISRKFIADTTDVFTFGAVKLRGYFVEAVDRNVELRELYVIAPAKTVECREVPTARRPENFIGVAGQFTLRSKLTPTRANVGDPMTLAIHLEGVGNLNFANPPALDRVTNVTSDFQVQKPTSDTDSSGRVFTYSIRPLRAGIREFPAIRASYFDVEEEAYVELETKPIPIEIAAAQRLAPTDIVSSNDVTVGTDTVVADNDGVFANISEVSRIRNHPVYPKFWVALWGTMMGLYAVAVLGLAQYRQRRSDPARLRRRSAINTAREKLAAAKREWAAGKSSEGVATIQALFTNLVADLTDRDAAGVTPRDAHNLLRQAGVSVSNAANVGKVLEACDAVRYGSTDDNTGLIGRSEQVLSEVLAELKSSGLLQ